MTHLAQGIFTNALKATGNHSLTRDIPLLLGFWALIMFVPWEAIGEGNGAMPWGIKTYDKLMQLGEAPFPWVAVLLTLAFAYAIFFTLREGLKDNGRPEQSHAFKRLKDFGDPYEIVAQFEAEASRSANSKHLSWDRPLAVGTLNWLLIQSRGQILLLPVDRIIWAYDKADATDGVIGFVFGQAGVMSKRQQRLAKDMAERVIHFWVEGVEDPVTISIPPHELKANELVDYLLMHNETMIWGYHPKLEGMFKKNRAGFRAAAQAYIAGGGKAGENDFSLFEDAFSAALDSLPSDD